MAKVKHNCFGGTGFIGYHVCKRAVKNFKVFSIENHQKLKEKLKGKISIL